MNYLQAALVFLAAITGSVLWVYYIRRTSQGKALESSIFSMIIYLLGGLIVSIYIGNKWYLLPAGLGTFIGGYISVKIDSKRRKK